MSMKRTIIAALIASAAVALTANAATSETDFIGRFGGSWAGSGTVVRGDVPVPVNCQATGQPAENQIAIRGNCSVAIVSIEIAADITYDPESDRYSGIYIGAKVGPAQVAGKRSGDVVNLAITWPAPVNGDTQARMRIENSGGGNLRIVVTDNTEPGGPDLTTHDLVLSQI
jgi:hypothetical protein